MNDLRFAIRQLGKSPGFAVVAVLTLALGIGANTTMFTAINAILLRPLPYPQPDRLVEILEAARQESPSVVAYPDFLDWQRQTQLFADMAAYQLAAFNLTGADEPERVKGLRITANFFRTLGVKPALGRDFLAEEDEPGGSAVLLLSYRLWERRFGADAAVIGRTVPVNGRGHVVVGVLPPGVVAYEEAQAFVPLGPQKPGLMSRGTRNALFVKGRLKPGVTRAQAQVELDVIAQRLEQQYPETNTSRRAVIASPRHPEMERDIQGILFTLMGAAGFVLLITCSNLASLLLARGAGRTKEMAMRLALGAGRTRLIRQLLVESALLALAGGAAGLCLGVWGCRGLSAMLPQIEQITLGGFTLDGRVFGFTLIVSLVTTLLFGLAPALRASKPDVYEMLKEGTTRSSPGLPRLRLQKALVVVQVALASVLLVGGGLLLQSLHRLMARDPGFDSQHVLTVKLHRGGAGTADAEREAAFWRELFTRLQDLPGVVSVAAAFPMPLERSSWTCPFFVEGQPLPARGQEAITDVFSVSSDYFHTLGTGLLNGRFFSPEEGAQSAKVALINRTLAERHWPGESPVGKRFRIFPLESPDPWRRVVGVVEDFRLHALDERPKPAVYLPSASGAGLILRTESDPLSLLAAVREQVRDLDPNQPLHDCKSLEQCMAESAMAQRVTCWLLGVFSGIALALAAVGIYGLISYSVAQRTHEIGVRMALGAERSQVTRLVVGGSLKLVLIGVAVGLAAAGGLTGFLTSLLYGVRPIDPATFAAVSGLLLGVAVLASYLPARRAARVDPVVALRCE
ncbi:MAG: ABC transporter permease [Verrucomicrobia bacterium]|nr:ABC transporter permease [Verrucomicrobiota bacterium]